MAWLDLPLAITAIFFFLISWLYGWGLLRWHRNDFAWDLAATIGIASIVSCTYSFVWTSRLSLGYEPIPILLQIPYDLAIIFLVALPGMTWVRVELRKDERTKEQQIEELKRRVLEQDEMMCSIEAIIREEGQRSLEEIIKVLEMRDEAKSMLREHINSLN